MTVKESNRKNLYHLFFFRWLVCLYQVQGQVVHLGVAMVGEHFV